MIAEISCILVGIPVGYALRQRPCVTRTSTMLASAIVYALLFLLGVSLGANDHLLSRLGELGLQGIGIGLSCALGSVLVTALIAHRYFCLPEKAPAPQVPNPQVPQGPRP